MIVWNQDRGYEDGALFKVGDRVKLLRANRFGRIVGYDTDCDHWEVILDGEADDRHFHDHEISLVETLSTDELDELFGDDD